MAKREPKMKIGCTPTMAVDVTPRKRTTPKRRERKFVPQKFNAMK